MYVQDPKLKEPVTCPQMSLQMMYMTTALCTTTSDFTEAQLFTAGTSGFIKAHLFPADTSDFNQALLFPSLPFHLTVVFYNLLTLEVIPVLTYARSTS